MMANQKFMDILKKIVTELQNNPLKMDAAKAQCNNQKTLEELVSFVWELEEVKQMLPTTLITSEKSEIEADKLRKSGNKHFQKKNYELALRDYNFCIINAPHPILRRSRNETKTESHDFPYIDPANYGGTEGECKMLAVGFANRSAVLLEMKMYEECLNDIYRAFEYGYPEAFRANMNQRKEQCLNLINNRESNNSTKSHFYTDATDISAASTFNTGASDNAEESCLDKGATDKSEEYVIELDATGNLGESHIDVCATPNNGEYPLDTSSTDNLGESPLDTGTKKHSRESPNDAYATDNLVESLIDASTLHNSGKSHLDENATENTSESPLYMGAINNSCESADDTIATGNSDKCPLDLSCKDDFEEFCLDVGTTNETEVPMDTSATVSLGKLPHEEIVIDRSYEYTLDAEAIDNSDKSLLYASDADKCGESLLGEGAREHSSESPLYACAEENSSESSDNLNELPHDSSAIENSGESYLVASTIDNFNEYPIDAGDTKNSGELPLHTGTTENFGESSLGVGVLDKSGQSQLCTDATHAEELSTKESGSIGNYFLSLLQPSPPPSETTFLDQPLSNKTKYEKQKPPSLTIPPFTVSIKHGFKLSKGRCLFASRAIKPGELLGAEEAFSVNIDTPELHLYCSTCVKKCVNPLPCPSCTKVVFCSESCRTKGLSEYHWLECKILPTLVSLDMTQRNLAIKMLRTLSYPKLNALIKNFKKKTTNPAGDLDCCSDGIYVADSYRSIHNLCTNKDQQSFEFLFTQCLVSYIFTELLVLSGRFFVDKNGHPVSPTRKAIIRTGATLLSNSIKLNCNPFQISDRNEDKSIGTGIFPLLSQLNHSCYPNVRHYSYDRTIMLRAIRPISAGEELTISYSHEFHKSPLEKRKEFLEKYHFTCTCEACQNKWPTFEYLPIIKYKCPECKMRLPGHLKICSDCLAKYSNPKTKCKMHQRKKAIEKMVTGIVFNTYDLDARIKKGASGNDFQTVCEHIDQLFKHIQMPCQNVMMLQNLLSKCFEDGF